MSARVPVTVLTGFLGSGKTTRLNALLRAPHGRRIAVVVNEFGEVGIDGARVAGASAFVELENGCLCCAVNEDLDRTLRALRARGGFDQLVVETTGLADPLPVTWTFGREGLVDFYRVDAVVTVVDAVNLERALAEAPEATLQIERADLVLLSKGDLAPDGGRAATARVLALNPSARLVPGPPGGMPWNLVLGAGPSAPAPAEGDAHRHASSWATWTFRTAATVAEGALEELLLRLPASVFRVKGLVRTDGPWGWTQVNAVAGRYELEPAAPEPAPAESALVFIGRTLDAAELAARCAAVMA
ncbi:MAG: GTP-binding protein [bacterium]|nr:GTP-binding protein [bacterium]